MLKHQFSSRWHHCYNQELQEVTFAFACMLGSDLPNKADKQQKTTTAMVVQALLYCCTLLAQ